MTSRVALVGATATGKTALAVALAGQINAELINADSRQAIREVQVGTGKPTAAELEGIVCHCLDIWDPGSIGTMYDWLGLARRADDDISSRGKNVVVVGGTGLYVTSFVDGVSERSTAPAAGVRARRQEQVDAGNLDSLVDELTARDPEAVADIDVKNPRRVLRALEILDSGANDVAVARTRRGGRPALMLGLFLTGATFEDRVRSRVEMMFSGTALQDEVARLRSAGCTDEAIRACGIGYGEALEVSDGLVTADEAITRTVARTLRYAKAQRTWWRRDGRITWLDADKSADELLSEAVAVIDSSCH